jgi:hypothetical protein
MFTLTINGNTPAELFANLAKLAAENGGIAPATAPQPAPPIANPTQAVAASTVPVAAIATTPPAQNATTPPFAPTANVPAAAPTYTLDALARAGATLAQSGKMEQALALLARYGVQTVNQLKPEQYGAFATELRALGAQV